MFKLSFGKGQKWLIGNREVIIGPTARPWLAIWSCPLHRLHAMARLPFFGYWW